MLHVLSTLCPFTKESHKFVMCACIFFLDHVELTQCKNCSCLFLLVFQAEIHSLTLSLSMVMAFFGKDKILG